MLVYEPTRTIGPYLSCIALYAICCRPVLAILYVQNLEILASNGPGYFPSGWIGEIRYRTVIASNDE